MDVPCPVAECRELARPPRHRHPAHDLRSIGETCRCGANLWVIIFGGSLPAIVSCGQCAASFNIGERLRSCGRDTSPGRSRVDDDPRYPGRDPDYRRRRVF